MHETICGPCGNYLCSMYGCQRRVQPAQTVYLQGPIHQQPDSIAKLAEAIERLAAALEKREH